MKMNIRLESKLKSAPVTSLYRSDELDLLIRLEIKRQVSAK